MKPILKWQYDQLVKELLLLQEHQANPDCPCDTEGEMCVRKHLMTIEGYAEETGPMEPDGERGEKLRELAMEAREHREREERALCGQDVSEDLSGWTRGWRKEMEGFSLACDVAAGNNGDKEGGQAET
ncbi:hypothetical protein [Desulfohalovibrio reitneri]|uniref:hypothetical protein n=1 Tax=Desulfohalovibrio reitneri TaxID=1307759 RepID=UPI0004A77E77|nr:hypothetical protein [Desulfohalovibrio reitneri]